jgi:hypothetical protein
MSAFVSRQDCPAFRQVKKEWEWMVRRITVEEGYGGSGIALHAGSYAASLLSGVSD